VFLLSLICNVHPDAQPLDVSGITADTAVHRGGKGAGAHARVAEEDVIQVPHHPAAGPIVHGNMAPPGECWCPVGAVGWCAACWC